MLNMTMSFYDKIEIITVSLLCQLLKMAENSTSFIILQYEEPVGHTYL